MLSSQHNLQNKYPYCKCNLLITRKTSKKQYKKNKLKIIAPTSNHEFELPDGSYSVSDIQDYMEYTIKKHETLTSIPPIHVYINRMKNRLVFKMKDGLKLELQMPEARKLFDSTKKLIDETKNGENAPSLEVDEVVDEPISTKI